MAVEQSIQAKMYEIAGTYKIKTERETMTKKAATFRLPYWNPFQARFVDPPNENDIPVTGLSLLFCVREINIKRPNTDVYVTIPNPQYAYRNPNKGELVAAYSGVLSTPDWIDIFLRTEKGSKQIPLEDYTVRCGVRGEPYSDHVNLQQNLGVKMTYNNGKAITMPYS
jgi:hypothetical protein